MIEGEHLANFDIGQFFFEKPDIEYFREQAAKYGYDEAAYLDALSEVPIIPKERIVRLLDFVTSFAEVLGDLGLRHIRQKEISETLRESERRFRMIMDGIGSDRVCRRYGNP